MSGKGSTPRPFSVSQEEFAENFDRIFGPKKSIDTSTSQDDDIDIENELRDVGDGAGLG